VVVEDDDVDRSADSRDGKPVTATSDDELRRDLAREPCKD
jgi:hypothetical protein